MNVFTNLLFSQNPAEQVRPFDEDDDRYATGYGNRIASRRFFVPFGHARSTQADDRRASTFDADLALGGCR